MSLKRRWALPILARPTPGAHTSSVEAVPGTAGTKRVWGGGGGQRNILWPCLVCGPPPANTRHQTHGGVHLHEDVLRMKNFLGDGWGRADNG